MYCDQQQQKLLASSSVMNMNIWVKNNEIQSFMCQLTVQPILQIAHEEPAPHRHFLKVSHTHMNDHKGRKVWRVLTSFLKVHPACQCPFSSFRSQEGQTMRNQDGSFEQQWRIVLVWCLYCTVCVTVCVHVHMHRKVLCKSNCRELEVVSGDGGKLFEQDVLTQCVQRDILPHIQADGAHLPTDGEGNTLTAHVSIKTFMERQSLSPISETATSPHQLHLCVPANASPHQYI